MRFQLLISFLAAISCSSNAFGQQSKENRFKLPRKDVSSTWNPNTVGKRTPQQRFAGSDLWSFASAVVQSLTDKQRNSNFELIMKFVDKNNIRFVQNEGDINIKRTFENAASKYKFDFSGEEREVLGRDFKILYENGTLRLREI
jgi:hypothetical protein